MIGFWLQQRGNCTIGVVSFAIASGLIAAPAAAQVRLDPGYSVFLVG